MFLTALTFLPLLGAIAIAILPSHSERNQRMIALGTTLIVAVLGLLLFMGFDGTSAASQFAVSSAWFALPGATSIPIHYSMGVDGISVLMVVLTALLMPIVILSTWDHIHKRVKEFMIWMLVMETGMLGVFLASDLMLFYFFWEISLVPLYFIVGIWGGDRRLYATVKFFLFTLAGSLVMLVGVIWMIYNAETASIAALSNYAAALALEPQAWLFGAFALAFAIKVPLLPFHTWLADAHTQAPTSGSIVLAGVLLKMGTYGLLRFGIGMFPQASISYAPLFMGLGAIGIVYGAFLAMAQTDIKRLVACSSVSHLGYVVLGMFALTHAGLRGSILQMVNHGLSTGMLFLMIGMIYERRHTRAIDQFGGIAASMPKFALLFVFAVLSSVGLPGLNGFVGEYMILLGSFQASPFWASLAVLGVIFGAVYLLSATRRVLFGPLIHDANRKLVDLGTREIGMCIPIVVVCIWIGVSPNTCLNKLDGSINQLVERLDGARVALQLDETEAAPKVAQLLAPEKGVQAR